MKTTTYCIYMWSDLSMYSDWFNQQSLMALVTANVSSN